MRHKQKLEQFKEQTRQRLEANIIRLRDTRGNFYLGIRLPTKDYRPMPIENHTKDSDSRGNRIPEDDKDIMNLIAQGYSITYYHEDKPKETKRIRK